MQLNSYGRYKILSRIRGSGVLDFMIGYIRRLYYNYTRLEQLTSHF
jgi:hypothetical protein